MEEKLIIKNFGPINSVELSLRRVNILIGDQGTGKSTVAKVLDILKAGANSVSGELHLFDQKGSKGEIEKSRFKNQEFSKIFFELLSKYDLKSYLTANSFIQFENTFCKIVIENFSNIQFEEKKKNGENSPIEKNTNVNYYIPAYREAFILLRNNYPAILNAKANLPVILNTFGQHFNNYRENIKRFNFKNIIGIDYNYANGRDLIILKNGKEISFEEASSAVNSVVPLLVVFLGVIDYMSGEGTRVYSNHICPFVTIEEPELNCFPSTQNELIKFLVEKIKFKDYEKSKEYYCNLLLTTHSPYILTTLNNLMYGYNLGENNSDDANRIIPQKNWLNPKDVSAYILTTKGLCENIMDEELKQIKVEKIDEISEILSEQWHELANLNFDK